jgi:hypothetical protein
MVRFVPSVLVAAFSILFALAPLTADAQPVAVVRVLDSRLARTLSEAVRRSPTLRALVDELERSDLIVHVTGRPPLEPHRLTRRLAGTLQFVTATPARRFLRITVDESLPPARRAAALAHELWHALEVANAREVVDHASFAALYRHIGHPSGGHARWYDTNGAVNAGETVRLELLSGRDTR